MPPNAAPGYHVPVLKTETLERLVTRPDGIYVDATLGGGGHARAIHDALGPDGRLIAIDRDAEAIAKNRPWAEADPRRVTLIHGPFGALERYLAELGLGRVDGILADLGVSSRQLDEGERGFSFLRPGPLDMRMDTRTGPTAAAFVEEASEAELARVLREYGEEPRARKIAHWIKEAQAKAPITTTEQLAGLLEEKMGRRGKKHPGTLTFQALRIAVNAELSELEALLGSFDRLLTPGGRLVVISYHSLEDRRVKERLRQLEPRCICDPRAPRCTCGHPGSVRLLERKAVKPGEEEIAANPRARSARLRAAQLLTMEERGGQS